MVVVVVVVVVAVVVGSDGVRPVALLKRVLYFVFGYVNWDWLVSSVVCLRCCIQQKLHYC